MIDPDDKLFSHCELLRKLFIEHKINPGDACQAIITVWLSVCASSGVKEEDFNGILRDIRAMYRSALEAQ